MWTGKFKERIHPYAYRDKKELRDRTKMEFERNKVQFNRHSK